MPYTNFRYLQKGNSSSFYCDHTHCLIDLKVKDQNFPRIEQEHVIPFGRQIGQLKAIIECHKLSTEKQKTSPWVKGSVCLFMAENVTNAWVCIFPATQNEDYTGLWQRLEYWNLSEQLRIFWGMRQLPKRLLYVRNFYTRVRSTRTWQAGTIANGQSKGQEDMFQMEIWFCVLSFHVWDTPCIGASISHFHKEITEVNGGDWGVWH